MKDVNGEIFITRNEGMQNISIVQGAEALFINVISLKEFINELKKTLTPQELKDFE
jgi:hypothetical protein